MNLDDVRGSGDHGRITKDDVLRASGRSTARPRPRSRRELGATAAARQSTCQPRARRQPDAAQLAQMINQGGGFVPPIPGVGYGAFKVPPYRPHEGDQVIPFTRRRRITADHMTYSKFASPHVVTVAEVDLHKASKPPRREQGPLQEGGALRSRCSRSSVVATARALRENPQLNARVLDDALRRPQGHQPRRRGRFARRPRRPGRPPRRRARRPRHRPRVDDLAKRARTGKITIDDLSGATFSVTNPGIKGNLFGGAIINQPNVGILRMGEIQKRVVVVEGADGEDQMAIHPVMYIALSYDHRIVDGVAANSFLWRVTEILEKGDFEV